MLMLLLLHVARLIFGDREDGCSDFEIISLHFGCYSAVRAKLDATATHIIFFFFCGNQGAL